MRPPPQDVERYVLALRLSVAALRRHAQLSPGRLLLDAGRRRSVERGLQLYFRSLIELTRRIGPAADRNPAAYPSSIACLAAGKVLPSDLGERLGTCATLGDALGAGRIRLGRRQMAKLLDEHLHDFDELADHVERWLAARRLQ